MCEGSSHIITGPEDDSGLPHTSMGKIVFDSLKKRHPDDVINIDAITKENVTCGQLLNKSVKMAAVLNDLSLGKGDVITIVSENDMNYIVPVLAAFYLGIGVNLLNPDYTEDELKRALIISKPKLVLCSESALETVLKAKKELVFLEMVLLIGNRQRSATNSIEELIKVAKADVESFEPQTFDCSQQSALILLSSGTTGFPKGVLLTHQNLRSSVVNANHPKFGGIGLGGVTVLVAPSFHIFGIIMHLCAIISSMQVVIMSKFKPDLFLKSIEEFKVTSLYIVPPLVNFLANSPLVDSFDTSSVCDIICGAAATGEEILHKASRRLGNVPIRLAYGLTELAGGCTYQMPGNIKAGSVGNLVPEIVAKVCDPDSQKILGPLENGELCFKGPMIMQKYMGNASDTHNSIDQDGFYHTGDVGFYDENQHFYIVDRLKELIKYKGFQVAPAELENLILSHPGIIDCGVIGIPDENAGEIPFAFVVCRSGTILSEKEVANFVAERISVHKQLHGGVRFIEQIPKSPSGKILRRELREIYRTLK